MANATISDVGSSNLRSSKKRGRTAKQVTRKGSRQTNKFQMLRYAAKLLFQFRVIVKGKPNSMRTCEERIVVFGASTPALALAEAKKRGRDGEHSYQNHAGNDVHFEFIGVLDLMHLGAECDEEEVWYDIKVMMRPKERSKVLIPSDKKLISSTSVI
jgi:hypothetical protein